MEPEPRSVEIGSGVEIKWHEPNPALTWDELKQMEGKPVWMEFMNGEKYWIVIRSIGQLRDGTWMMTDDTEFYTGNGKNNWRAYREERK